MIARVTGFEPAIPAVTGQCFRPLSYTRIETNIIIKFNLFQLFHDFFELFASVFIIFKHVKTGGGGGEDDVCIVILF